VPGQIFGTLSPAVRKKSTGEMKESNVLAGPVNSFSFMECRAFSSHSSSGFSFDEEVVEGWREVPILVQSKIPFLTMRPAIRCGSCFDTKDSVRAREVASVPPR